MAGQFFGWSAAHKSSIHRMVVWKCAAMLLRNIEFLPRLKVSGGLVDIGQNGSVRRKLVHG